MLDFWHWAGSRPTAGTLFTDSIRALTSGTAVSSPSIRNRDAFAFDSRATSHFSPFDTDFDELHPIPPRSINGFDGNAVQAIGMGTVRLRCGRGGGIALREVLYVPQAAVRLISVGRLCDAGLDVTFTAGGTKCSVAKPGGRIIATGSRISKRLYLYDGRSPTIEHANVARAAPNLHTWHLRLGHADPRTIADMAKKDRAQGMHIDLSNLPPSCEHCILGKKTKKPVPKVREGGRAKERLDVVYVDLMGPMAVQSASGKQYAMDLVDDATSMLWTILLANKDDALPELKQWEADRFKETGCHVGTFHTDSGELKSVEMTEWLATKAIWQEFTAPYTSAHIGKVERSHRTIMNRGRAMRSSASLPPNTWAECVLTASYLAVRTAASALDGMTPYEAYFGHKSDLSHPREFGARAFVLIQNEHNPKLFNRSIECVLIGYSPNSKAYRT